MHTPTKFKQTDTDQLKSVIHDFPFATLVTHSSDGLDAHHIPIILTQSDGRDVLQGHIAKANPLWKKLDNASDVLLIFHGPNCYVSPNYYPSKLAHGKAVPTWNYVTVHVQGSIRFIHDSEWNLNMLNHLTNKLEKNQTVPWSTEDAPGAYIQRMLTAIVGLEIQISAIEGKWKLSQNQPSENQRGVVESLSLGGSDNAKTIARLVKEHALNEP